MKGISPQLLKVHCVFIGGILEAKENGNWHGIGWAAVGYYEQGSCKFLDVKELDL